jgi:hypothetical protein
MLIKKIINNYVIYKGKFDFEEKNMDHFMLGFKRLVQKYLDSRLQVTLNNTFTKIKHIKKIYLVIGV